MSVIGETLDTSLCSMNLIVLTCSVEQSAVMALMSMVLLCPHLVVSGLQFVLFGVGFFANFLEFLSVSVKSLLLLVYTYSSFVEETRAFELF